METVVGCRSLSLPTIDQSSMQPPSLHHVAGSRFDTYNILLPLVLFLLHNTAKESCEIKHNKYFTPSRFSTLTNVQTYTYITTKNVTHPAVQDLKLNCSYGAVYCVELVRPDLRNFGRITSMLRSHTIRKKPATTHTQSIELNHCDHH